MGRVKLQIRRLETALARQTTYSKRKAGILKKARELSILCDIDIVLVMFSPTSKPTLFVGDKSTLEEVIDKFAQLPPQERAKRKLQSLEALKKAFEKSDHDFRIEDFLNPSSRQEEVRNEELPFRSVELRNDVRMFKARLAELHRRLGFWEDSVMTSNLDHVRAAQESLGRSLNAIRLQKEKLAAQQTAPADFTGQQVQNNAQLPLAVGDGQLQPQPLSGQQSQSVYNQQFQNNGLLPLAVGDGQPQPLSWQQSQDFYQQQFQNNAQLAVGDGQLQPQPLSWQQSQDFYNQQFQNNAQLPVGDGQLQLQPQPQPLSWQQSPDVYQQQFQNDINLPVSVGGGQLQPQPLSLAQSQDFQHLSLPNDGGARDIGCSSVPANSGYFNVDQPVEEHGAMEATPGKELTQNGGQTQIVENHGVQSSPCADIQAGYPTADDLDIQIWGSSSGTHRHPMFEELSYPRYVNVDQPIEEGKVGYPTADNVAMEEGVAPGMELAPQNGGRSEFVENYDIQSLFDDEFEVVYPTADDDEIEKWASSYGTGRLPMFEDNSFSGFFEDDQTVEGKATEAAPQIELPHNGGQCKSVGNYDVQARYSTAGEVEIENWGSSSGTGKLSMFEEHSYSQIPAPAISPMMKPPDDANNPC